MSGDKTHRILVILTDYLYMYESCLVLVQILYPEAFDRVQEFFLLELQYSRILEPQRGVTQGWRDPRMLEQKKVSIVQIYPRVLMSSQRACLTVTEVRLYVSPDRACLAPDSSCSKSDLPLLCRASSRYLSLIRALLEGDSRYCHAYQ